jgi:hypothetical protein
MRALIGFMKNILELIGVLFKYIFIKIEDGIRILKKDLVYSSTARVDEEKEAKVRQSMKGQANEFDTGLEDEYLYTTGTRWSRDVEDYEEPIGI